MEYILLRNREIENIRQIDVYRQHGGYEALRKAVGMEPDDVINEVKKSNLRGRGGAGFPAGVKWSFIPKHEPVKYVVVNADESEPGTFKDRELLAKNPHQVIEGALIAAYAIQAKAVYIYCRGEFWDLCHALDEHIQTAREAGFVGDNILDSGWSCNVYTHLGAGAYICGEETALLNSLQGLLGQPRVRPPFPAMKGGGLYYEPTVVNNVETLANVPWIISNGADAYLELGGGPDSPGHKIYCVSGCVEKPGNYELPLGITMRELLYDHAGGIKDGNELKAVLPSGPSAPVLPASDDMLDTPMTYESYRGLGSELGSASVIVCDETINMAWAGAKMISFFSHESCGKCTPCREGTFWTNTRYKALLAGKAKSSEEIDRISSVAVGMGGLTLCALGEFAVNPVRWTVEHFREDYEHYIPVEEEEEPKKKGAKGKARGKKAAAR